MQKPSDNGYAVKAYVNSIWVTDIGTAGIRDLFTFIGKARISAHLLHLSMIYVIISMEVIR